MVPLPSTLVVPQCVHSCCFAVHSSPLLAFGQSARKAARFTPSSRASESELPRSNKFKRISPQQEAARSLSLLLSSFSPLSLSLSTSTTSSPLSLPLGSLSLLSLSARHAWTRFQSSFCACARACVATELSYLGNEIASQVCSSSSIPLSVCFGELSLGSRCTPGCNSLGRTNSSFSLFSPNRNRPEPSLVGLTADS